VSGNSGGTLVKVAGAARAMSRSGGRFSSLVPKLQLGNASWAQAPPGESQLALRMSRLLRKAGALH